MRTGLPTGSVQARGMHRVGFFAGKPAPTGTAHSAPVFAGAPAPTGIYAAAPVVVGAERLHSSQDQSS
ncbi:protein of unknown function [Pseudomonas sp. JV551A1]|nr:protein of unknown function [Pseudomonas sp. JV551A1]